MINRVASGAALREEPRLTLTTGPGCVDATVRTLDADGGGGLVSCWSVQASFLDTWPAVSTESGGFKNPTEEPVSPCGGWAAGLPKLLLQALAGSWPCLSCGPWNPST